ncbi:MAG: DUF4340 domain-containing protein [bacterium]
MNSKKTIIFLFLLIIICIVAFMVRAPKDNKNESNSLFPGFDPASAASIVIDNKSSIINLKKIEDTWVVVEEDNLPAGEDQINKALDTIVEINKDTIISRNPEKQSIYEVDPNSGLEVVVKDKNDSIIADLFIGKSGPDFMSTYVRKKDSHEVISHRGFHLKSEFDKTPQNWVDKTVVALKMEDIDKVEFIHEDEGAYLIMRDEEDENKWKVISPVEASLGSEASSIVRALASLRAQEIKRQDKELTEYGLDNPLLTLKITLKDGKIYTERMAKIPDKEDYYLKVDEKEYLYTIAKYNIERVNKKWLDLVDRSVVKIDEKEIKEITFAKKGNTYTIARGDNGEWEAIKPEKVALKTDMINDIVKTLTNLRALEVLWPEDLENELKEYGLDIPQETITLVPNEGDAIIEQIGKLFDTKKDKYYFKLHNKNFVYLIGKYSIDKLLFNWEDVIKKEG